MMKLKENHKITGIILPSCYKTPINIENVHTRINELGYRSIYEYLYIECFTGLHTSDCEIARDLNVSDMTFLHKKTIVQSNMDVKVSKRENKLRCVHWLFKCGCEYKGQRYRFKNKRVCMKHGESLMLVYKVCQDKKCGVTFKVGPEFSARIFCDDCIGKRRESHFKKRRQRKKLKQMV